ncbi:MAG: DUF4249 family protein [Saprospiraceae bacterium]|nr:DUF4249 family protein [Saprospiraceae bacterium]
MLLIGFVSFLFLRCAREVIIDLPDEPTKLVAVCHFTDGENFRVRISLSQAVNDGNEPEFLQSMVDATLSVDGQFWDRLKPDTTIINEITYWESNRFQKAESGVEYAFSVRVPGYPSIQSSSKIPDHVDLEAIVLGAGDVSIVPLSDGQSELRIPLELRLKNLPVGEHYFAFNLTHETDVYETLNPPVFDHKEESRTNFLTDGRTFSLLHDIPEPVVLINENYWADDRRTLYLTARIPFDPETDQPRLIFVEWRTLSEQFYRYHLSLSRQGSNLPFSDPDAVFNNIKGGYGNFSGYAVSLDTVVIPDF